MGSTTPLLYWQINIPPSLRESTCPPFLLNLSAKDCSIISTPDELYQVLSWTQVQQIIKDNRLDAFQRLPSNLRRYLGYIYSIKKSHGSVMNFVLQERLKWKEPVEAAGKPFEKEEDVKVLWNDWPYGIDERIVHLVVWTKFELEDDLTTNDLTDEARGSIEKYVEERFRRRCGDENVVWFKNWRTLKSVHAVEHFHVMLFDPDPDFVKEVTNGDVPLSRKL
ncbi:uncharacterized protein PAC_00831 [Phialocephala subalpina]|uniref:N-acetylglucosamine-induced protein 1 n=1 Tax=Phialocephala subalpina TaxID=576137 RepID=A0A1L7WDT6_9HELO|nr:uncharacterized protein PAC_00831 [Phialocephala subalpina]